MINVLLCLLGTIGFCAILNVPKRMIIIVSIGACISGAAFEIMHTAYGYSVFISTLTAVMLIGIYSEICARVLKAPSTIILLPSTIPLLPGGSLYYTMRFLVTENYNQFFSYAKETISIAFAIAMGAVVTSLVTKSVKKLKRILK